MTANESAEFIRTYRRKRIIGEEPANVAIARAQIERILPHRDPILLVDSIDYVDLVGRRIRGRRFVDPADPVFRGHFPETAIYPGTSVVEMIGQLSLCLYYFIRSGRIDVAADAEPAPVRATRILGAHFIAPVFPGSEVVLEAVGFDDDGFFASAAGQAVVDGSVMCVSVGEVCFVG